MNISSIGGKVPVPHLLPYSVSKFALTGFSEGLRAELGKYGIKVTTVCPGLMRAGSPVRATFKGQSEKEFAWFALGDSLPGLSMDAAKAARRIMTALKRGEAEVILTLPAALAARAHGLAPGLSSNVAALVSGMLPVAPSGGGEARAGADSRSELMPDLALRTTDGSALANNQTS